RRFTYDIISHDLGALRHLIDTVGADRVALGTDFCFDMGLERPLATIQARAVGLSKKDQDRVIRGTGARLLRLRWTPDVTAGLLDHPDVQRPVVRRPPLSPREWTVADLRRHAHRQPRPRLLLHAGRLYRPDRRAALAELRGRAAGRRSGGRAHRNGHGAALPAPAQGTD